MEDLLRKNGLKRTPIRVGILKFMDDRKYAVTSNEIEAFFGNEADRVTVYRILKVFEEKGIIHKVVDTHGKVKFALCAESCTEHRHDDDHIHFSCIRCHQIYCLRSTPFPKIELPEGYLSYSTQLAVEGICEACALH